MAAETPIYRVEMTRKQSASPIPPKALPGMVRVFGYSIWQVCFWAVVLVLALGLLVFPTGLARTVTSNPSGDVNTVGQDAVTVPILGKATQLEVFVVFMISLLGTLVLLSAIIGLLMVTLDHKIIQARETTTPPARPPWILRQISRLSGWLAYQLRKLPATLGNR